LAVQLGMQKSAGLVRMIAGYPGGSHRQPITSGHTLVTYKMVVGCPLDS
jgi:hypothetical protein